MNRPKLSCFRCPCILSGPSGFSYAGCRLYWRICSSINFGHEEWWKTMSL